MQTKICRDPKNVFLIRLSLSATPKFFSNPKKGVYSKQCLLLAKPASLTNDHVASLPD